MGWLKLKPGLQKCFGGRRHKSEKVKNWDANVLSPSSKGIMITVRHRAGEEGARNRSRGLKSRAHHEGLGAHHE